jgi:hypothetical protein
VRSDEVAGGTRFGRGRLLLGKASLALAFAVIVALICAATGGQQAVAQITTATVDQYLTEVGEDASTASRGFRESRSRRPEVRSVPDTSSSGTFSNTANIPSASESGMTGDAAAASLGASANAIGDGEAGRRRAANLSSLPETGGPDDATLLWGVIALVSLLPCLAIVRTAHRGADP